LYRICRKNLKLGNDVSYSNLNKIISQVTSSMTLSMRFDGMLNVDLQHLHTNLVPYPKLHFMLSSLAPLGQMGTTHFMGCGAKTLTSEVFNPNNMMVNCDPSQGHYMAACVMYRGAINPTDVSQAITAIKKRNKFANWCPVGVKVGINPKPMVKIPGDGILEAPSSACLIGNNTAITDVFTRIDKKYDKMYERRAFLHWYIREGMEDGEFPDAREDIDDLRADYQNVIEIETAQSSPQRSATISRQTSLNEFSRRETQQTLSRRETQQTAVTEVSDARIPQSATTQNSAPRYPWQKSQPRESPDEISDF